MGYPSRIQRIKRKRSEQYYVNVPSALAHALEMTPGEVIEWTVEEKSRLVICREKTQILKAGQRAMRQRTARDRNLKNKKNHHP
jgi:bifunctional DNA-binding transcriptional regulator/antitoxin component of YhaV-PrlF toxin-antitoxin module